MKLILIQSELGVKRLVFGYIQSVLNNKFK